MEPNLTQFIVQYDLWAGDPIARQRIAAQALEYTVKWLTEHPEAVEQETRLVGQLQRFSEEFKKNPQLAARVREASKHLKTIRNLCAVRDMKNNFPQGTSYRQFMDFLSQAWGNTKGGMASIGRSATQFFSNMGRSAKELGMGIGGLMTAMASGAAGWINGMLAECGLTLAGVMGGIALIALVIFAVAVYMHYWRSNKPIQTDPLFDSWGSGKSYVPPMQYRPQNL